MIESTLDYISIILLISVPMFILYKIFKKKVLKPEYQSIEYWNRRYEILNKNFEWYASPEKLFSDFEILTLLEELIKKPSKILELGCGSSNLSYFLASQGYKNIKAIDYSAESIRLMNDKYSHINISYLKGDFYKMKGMFKENEFDLVIEKAGLDTIGTMKDRDEIKSKMRLVFEEIYYVLRNDGHLITISNNNFEFWEEVIHENVEKEGLFQVVDKKRSVFINEQNTFKMNYYFFLLRKCGKVKR